MAGEPNIPEHWQVAAQASLGLGESELVILMAKEDALR